MAASIAEQKEGIATYASGQFLHMYTGFRVWQTGLRAGDQNGPLQGLYSTLAHLTPTAGSVRDATCAPTGSATRTATSRRTARSPRSS